MSRATSSSVHRFALNPCEAGGRAMNRASRFICGGVRAGIRRACGFAFRPPPPRRLFFFHRDTDAGLTPSRRATWRTPRPARSIADARRRRASNFSFVPFGLI
jgi:hypothetical protein